MLNPTAIIPPATASDDPRCGHFIASDPGASPRCVLIGFGSDAGVRRNGGRPGAAAAPDQIRQALYKMTPDPTALDAHGEVLRQTVDAGNIRCTGEVELDQQALGREVARWLDQGVRPIILGGGHETTYGHFLGYATAGQKVHLLNLDAHADVRPLKDGLPHSGSPFRQAMEHPGGDCAGYTVFGLARWATARTHVAYLESAEAAYYWDDETTPEAIEGYFATLHGSALMSLDMDVLEPAHAPGVSAPAAEGGAARYRVACLFSGGAIAGDQVF